LTFVRGDRLTQDCKIVISYRGTSDPYCEVVPRYSRSLGPHAEFYRITGNDRELVLTLGWGGLNTLIRWLPLVRSAARRMEASDRRTDPDSRIDTVA